jgi:DNA invertase Pin-like site-specific DNA recombinase
MKTGAYMRVSTDEQNTELQRRDIENYANNHLLEITGWYEDAASGREGKSRPQLDELLRDAARGKIRAVVFWKIDRFSRSLKDFITLVEEFEKSKCRVISVMENLDFGCDDPFQKGMRYMLALFAEIESGMISQRVKASYRARRAKGKVFGPKVQRPCEEIQRMLTEGYSYREITAALGVSMGAVGRSRRVLRAQK